jgi:hypothetical protein
MYRHGVTFALVKKKWFEEGDRGAANIKVTLSERAASRKDEYLRMAAYDPNCGHFCRMIIGL